ncbi:MAG: hypothetical protein D9V47_00960 [Clostridia bacterium]|nr:MAG: hypothetical protein D9V47_00960 [Clostridia bacterium]
MKSVPSKRRAVFLTVAMLVVIVPASLFLARGLIEGRRDHHHEVSINLNPRNELLKVSGPPRGEVPVDVGLCRTGGTKVTPANC